jgi:short-subunit dehydrogenase
VQQLNGQACYSLVKGLLPAMIKENKGAIVAVSSIMHMVSLRDATSAVVICSRASQVERNRVNVC